MADIYQFQNVNAPADGNDEELSDVFSASCFVRDHAGEVIYVTGHGKWYEYDGTVWKIDNLRHIIQRGIQTTKNMLLTASQCAISAATAPTMAERDALNSRAQALLRHAKLAQSKAKLDAMISIASTAPTIVKAQSVLDADDMLFAVQNGVVELGRGVFRESAPSDLLTRQAAAGWRVDPDCSKWLEFLEQVQPDPDVRDWLQRFVGYCLTGSTEEQIFLVCHGVGANGKTVFWEIIKKLLGTYATASQFETFCQRFGGGELIRNDIARLFGARLVIAPEGSEGARLDEGMIKQITGGDELTARFLHREFFTFRPRFKVVLITNHKPVISGSDHGIWRRVVLLPWSVIVPPGRQDKRLTDKLSGELDGILGWALQGLASWRERGLSDLPPTLVNSNSDYRLDSDVVGLWLEDCCHLSPEAMTGSSDLVASYGAWAMENGCRQVSQKLLGERLRERGLTPAKMGNKRGWRGIRLKT